MVYAHPAQLLHACRSRSTRGNDDATFAPGHCCWHRCSRSPFPPAFAQAYPSRPVRLIVPFAPGGFTDVVARILGQKLSASLGQQFVVENKAGAGSTIGTDFVAKAPPDGYTLVMVSSTHVISPWIYKNLPYDPIKSFTVVSKLVDSPYVLLVNPKVQARNVQEFIALAKAAPDIDPLRFFGQRQRPAPDGRVVRGDDRRAAQARAVPRQRRRRDRTWSPAWSRAASPACRMRWPRSRRAVCERWPSPPRSAFRNCPMCPTHAGGRRCRLRGLGVAGPAGAGGHACRHRRQTE